MNPEQGFGLIGSGGPVKHSDSEAARVSIDRIVLIAVGTAAFFLAVGAWVLHELTP